jgi:hypothetical protein
MWIALLFIETHTQGPQAQFKRHGHNVQKQADQEQEKYQQMRMLLRSSLQQGQVLRHSRVHTSLWKGTPCVI